MSSELQAMQEALPGLLVELDDQRWPVVRLKHATLEWVGQDETDGVTWCTAVTASPEAFSALQVVPGARRYHGRIGDAPEMRVLLPVESVPEAMEVLRRGDFGSVRKLPELDGPRGPRPSTAFGDAVDTIMAVLLLGVRVAWIAKLFGVPYHTVVYLQDKAKRADKALAPR